MLVKVQIKTVDEVWITNWLQFLSDKKHRASGFIHSAHEYNINCSHSLPTSPGTMQEVHDGGPVWNTTHKMSMMWRFCDSGNMMLKSSFCNVNLKAETTSHYLSLLNHLSSFESAPCKHTIAWKSARTKETLCMSYIKAQAQAFVFCWIWTYRWHNNVAWHRGTGFVNLQACCLANRAPASASCLAPRKDTVTPM